MIKVDYTTLFILHQQKINIRSLNNFFKDLFKICVDTNSLEKF